MTIYKQVPIEEELPKTKLIKEIIDYTCVIRVWEQTTPFGKETYSTIHPKF